MLAGQGFRLIVQAIYFTVIARTLGAQNYGAFVGVVGLVGIQMPFAALGSGFLLIKNVSRDKSQFRINLGRALSITLVSSTILFAVVVLLSSAFLHGKVPLALVMFVAGADLFGSSVISLCGHAFIAFERMGWTALINVMMSSFRLAAAIILGSVYHKPAALQWGQFYFESTIIVSAVSLLLVFFQLGIPKFEFSRPAGEVREGFYFSVMQSAQTIYNDIDKVMLARLGTLEATGIYGAAYRVVDVSFAPVASLLTAAYPNFFRVGLEGIPATIRYVKPLILRAVGYAVVISILMLATAGLLPLFLGTEYRLSAEALRWLAVLPILKAGHVFLADSLSGAGHQGMRTAIGATVAVFNVLINLWIIPRYSWRGAAWSSIASDGLLLCAVGTAVYLLSRRAQTTRGIGSVSQARVEA